MPAKTTLVIATRNEGKISEIRELLKYQPIDIKNLNDFGPIPEIVEDGETFDDNAYKKSSMTARILGLPALADDSGLVVAALGGAPGVLSARYAGTDATDRQRCEKLLQEMAGRSDRRAFFQCVISIAVPSGPALTYEAACHGFIAETMAGAGGFGYDPIFYYPELNKTFAEMNLAEKNRISHRARALMEMAAEFDKVLAWIRRHSPAPQRVGCGAPGDEGA
ncbi:MAG: XTP/dITP diphosphatase [Thermodesulfobacteriota bacterium]